VGLPLAPLCKAESITDDFDDGVIDARWRRSFAYGGGTGVEVDGQLLITLPDEAAGVGYQHTSAQAFDLRESSFAIEVVQPHMGADGQGWIEINRHEALTNAQRYLGFNFSGDQLHCAYDVGAGSVRLASVPLSTVD